MGIRIQPREIDVPENDPFKNDLLGRKESVEVLTHLVGNFEGPCVLAVDAAWGNGKTTFLRIWAQYLHKQGFPVVEFNAWETDFSGDPFVALSTELTEGLHEYKDEPLATKIADTKKKAKEFIQWAVPVGIRLATAAIPVVGSELGKTIASYAEDRLSEYQKSQESVEAFRHVLQDLAEQLSKLKDRPLIVMIDELDRCRPSYAIELLEVAKHLFSVDHIVFVLAVNRSELAHSIRALYGSGFDAEGYLRRFFDVDFRLPEPDRKSFIDAMMDTQQIKKHFGEELQPNIEHVPQNSADADAAMARTLLQDFLRASNFSLRQIGQTIHRLGLVFASLRNDQRSLPITAVVALILRTLDAERYHRFCSGEVSDQDLIEGVFERPEIQALREEYSAYWFEATVIAAKYELSGNVSVDWTPSASPLLSEYMQLVSAENPEAESSDPRLQRGSEVIRLVELFRQRTIADGSMGFKHSVARIELLSPGLIDERSGADFA